MSACKIFGMCLFESVVVYYAGSTASLQFKAHQIHRWLLWPALQKGCYRFSKIPNLTDQNHFCCWPSETQQ